MKQLVEYLNSPLYKEEWNILLSRRLSDMMRRRGILDTIHISLVSQIGAEELCISRRVSVSPDGNIFSPSSRVDVGGIVNDYMLYIMDSLVRALVEKLEHTYKTFIADSEIPPSKYIIYNDTISMPDAEKTEPKKLHPRVIRIQE